MKCKNCGTELIDDSICDFCGLDNNKKDENVKNYNGLIAVIIIVVSLLTLLGIIICISNEKSNKLVCKSDKGNITIRYDDEMILGYKSEIVNYSEFIMNFDYSIRLVRQYGLAEFLDALKNFFEEESNGTCTYEGVIPKMKNNNNPLNLRNV